MNDTADQSKFRSKKMHSKGFRNLRFTNLGLLGCLWFTFIIYYLVYKMFRIRKEVKDFSSKISVLSRPTLPKRSYRHTSLQSYHSYPDPDDKPVITSAKSTVKPKLDKSSMKLDSKFRLDKIYPGFSASDKSNNLPAPKTEMTKLANGLTVASQDVPGLMTSFAFMVRAGRYFDHRFLSSFLCV